MRFLDRYVGKIIIIALFCFQSVDFLLPGRRKNTLSKGKINNILIQKYFGIGSIINAIPLINELKRGFPGAKIIFMTFSGHKELFDITKIADEAIYINPSSLATFTNDTLKALGKLFRTKIDVSIDLEFFSKSSTLMSSLSGSPLRVGLFAHFHARSLLLTHPVGFNHYKHISRIYLAMTKPLGLEISEESYDLTLPSLYKEHCRDLETLIEGLCRHKIIVINVNASTLCNSRKWPMDNFIELIDWMVGKYNNFTYVFIGSENE